MSKLTEQLKTIGIFNPHNLVGNGHPFICWRSRSRCQGQAWMLYVKGKKFDTHWDNYGAMSFGTWTHTNWRAAVAGPLAKCAQLFPGLEMVKGPWPNTYVPKVDLDKVIVKLQEKKS